MRALFVQPRGGGAPPVRRAGGFGVGVAGDHLRRVRFGDGVLERAVRQEGEVGGGTEARVHGDRHGGWDAVPGEGADDAVGVVRGQTAAAAALGRGERVESGVPQGFDPVGGQGARPLDLRHVHEAAQHLRGVVDGGGAPRGVLLVLFGEVREQGPGRPAAVQFLQQAARVVHVGHRFRPSW